MWVVVLVGALALYLFWDDIFSEKEEEVKKAPVLPVKAGALAQNAQTATMALMPDRIKLV